MRIKQAIWIEKYRPKILSDVVGQDAVVSRLKSYVETGNMPHLLFTGKPGVGKTASAVSLTREMFGETWRENFIELNASDERGIDVVRHKIKNFSRIAPMGDAEFKIIFLDEADALTSDAQSALRRTMEQYSSNCRFILSCNYSSKIIEPIQSRCAVYRFGPISMDAVEDRILHIAQVEGLNISEDGVKALKYVSQGDMRKAINAMQSASMIGEVIDESTIYQITATARPEEISDLIMTAYRGDFYKAREKLDMFLTDHGLSGEDIVGQMYRAMFDQESIPDKEKVALMDVMGEIDFRISEGANEHIQLVALLAHFTQEGSKHI